MKILEVIAYTVAVFVIATTFASFLRTDLWWIRIFDFPRMQLLVVGLVALALILVRADLGVTGIKVLAGFLVAAILVQCWFIFPYTVLSTKQVKNAGDRDGVVGVFVANVLMENRQAVDLEQDIARFSPDLILITEADTWWTERLSHLEESHPHTVKYPLDNTYGMNLYSRFPLSGSEVRFLIDPEIPSIRTTVRVPNGRTLLFYGLHPTPPGGEDPEDGERQDSDDRDAELVVVAKEVAELDGPIIVAGDFNDVAWSHTTRLFQRTSRLLDPRVGRGFFNSYNAQLPLLRYPLDHLFSSDHFTLIRLERMSYFASDHFPILVVLNLEPEAAREQEAPSPRKGDAEEAREILGRVEGEK